MLSLRVNWYQLKMDCYKYILWKPHSIHKGKTCSSYTKDEDKWKHLTTKYHQITKDTVREEERNRGNTKQETNKKMTITTPYLSKMTLNVNGLNSKIRRNRIWPNFMLPIRDSL